MADDSMDNPYNKTYLKNHKDIKLSKKFGKSQSKPAENDRKDYKSLSRVKLFTIDNILSDKECDELIKSTNKIGYVPITFEYPTDYRQCERIICKSFNLASIIWNKILPYFTRNDVEDIRPYGFGNSGIWRPTHINEAIRFTRYRNGDYFKSHRDGGYTKSNLNRSVYTIMIYLNDAKGGDFSGGDTVFYSLKKGTEKNTKKPTKDDLFLTDEDKKNAKKVIIKPKKGMCVIFNHDVWHSGETVHTSKSNKYKFILRTDIMFENYNCETFDRNKLIKDPFYIKAQKLYKMTVDLQNEGKVNESTISYLKALSIQTTLPSVITDKNEQYYGKEYYWFNNDIYEHLFSFLDVYRLCNACYVSRAWNYYASSPNLWKSAYAKYFNLNEIQSTTNNSTDTAYNSLFRPWKHIFSYRVMIKKYFPIVVLNFWMNGVEIAASSKKQAKNQKNKSAKNENMQKYYNNDQKLMTEQEAQYIPFVTSEYLDSNNWSWKPHRKEILFGRICFTAFGRWRFGAPHWIIDENGIMNGLLFHKLLKQILYFPNIVLSLPSFMYDNALFMLYLKYMLTKFNTSKFSKIFCLMLKSMEEEIAKYHKCTNCIVMLCEHRTFSVSVIKNGQRMRDIKFKREFIAYKDSEYAKKKRCECFPNQKGYFHYRDDYDDSFYIANMSHFDFITSIHAKNLSKLGESMPENELMKEVKPVITGHAYWNKFKHRNPSTAPPEPIMDEMSEEKENDGYKYFEIGQKDEKLSSKMEKRLSKEKFALLGKTNLSLDTMESLVNDMYVGPNKGRDIPQNDDFEHLISQYDRNRYPEHYLKTERKYDFYQKDRIDAPFNDGLSYAPFDIVLALNEILNGCNDQKIFHNEDDTKDDVDEIAVILVGSLTNYYGEFISEFVNLYNEDEDFEGVKVKYMNEYVQNEGTTKIEDRSSALKHLIQTVVTPEAVSNFNSISDIKNEIIIQMEPKPKPKKEKKDKDKVKNVDKSVPDVVKSPKPKKASIKSKFAKLLSKSSK